VLIIRKKINYKSLNQKGLTLVELMVTMVILSIVIGLTLSVLFNVQKTQRKLDEKYACNEEANRIAREIENSLRLAQKLIEGKNNKLKFLDINNDTTEYYLKGDTLFKNEKPATNLSVDSLYFIYVKIEENEKITDFYVLDTSGDAILDDMELTAVSGIRIYMRFSCPQSRASKKIKIKKRLFILLRNLQN